MNIAVAVRLMPKAGEELELDPGGRDIDREYVDMTICDFDDQALEEAVLIKEATGATVTAVGLKADGIDEALRVAYARGADRVVIVDAGELDPYDSRTAALAFADAFRQLGPDLVLVGVQTPYDLFGQTAPVLAVALGWPQASVVVGVTVEDGDRARAAGVRRRAPVGTRPAAAGGRRRPVREPTAALRVDGPAALGDDRGAPRRRSRSTSRPPPKAPEVDRARPTRAASPRHDARRRCRARGRTDRVRPA